MQYIRQTLVNYFQSIDFSAVIETILLRTIQIIMTVIILWLLKRILSRLVEAYFDKTKAVDGSLYRRLTLKKLLLNIIQYSYYFLLAYSLLAIIGVPVATLLAGAGVASLAIGLGAQGFVTDMVNGIFILVERQFDVGEDVRINDYSGTIENIGIRTTVLRDFNGAVHFIPNRNIENVTNDSRLPRRADIDLMIDPTTDMEALDQLIKDTVTASLPNDHLVQEPNFYGVTRDSEGRLIYRVRFMCKNDEQWDVEPYYYALLTHTLAKNHINQPLIVSPSTITPK
ncbi:mechanosensitive ion channel family protein [Aerococcus kribbianus]|uniref:Mechanosensitive ion channel family protein n=1 Tax=Aerococcus kribbianus TaxID=2999064 RepID=A0A9X3FMM4_9LACT|nr:MULTISPECIES: mechanosensitive ion channel family protein [unclassified Aerococcus]MCZ0717039.1 mechanosensitive ion channel family protein [Aerococcus sp. YH-aer221]MCZ0725327.1 mechanosensitive ion channel family protein [Aerococcus sp. YH-aer222]